ncbi:hypothetical protein GCM10011374_41340 [Kocuria dechangensis]|uniref:Uncharacterized protein n=1 Tax=Kocuria dechangensis TaxID=1176249 RepID=A0A917HA15_9MICC|nr:hypothetical protein [Kocuria dechangensis]GGG72288.1 hypothetical protein GCM10011374_41340 [Kocuria dechangensis]
MAATSMLGGVGAAAVAIAVAWWGIQWVRRWRTAVRLRRIQAYHASLGAEVRMSYERIYTRCAARPTWSSQKLADLEWAFAQVDHVLEKRRLDDLAEVGRTVPPVGPTRAPALVGTLGAVTLVVVALAGS